MTATHELPAPVVLRSHDDGRFAVAVTDRFENGNLGLLVQERSDVSGRQTVVILREADILAMLALSRGETLPR